MEFAGGALRCGEFVTVRKVGDASQKVMYLNILLIHCDSSLYSHFVFPLNNSLGWWYWDSASGY